MISQICWLPIARCGSERCDAFITVVSLCGRAASKRPDWEEKRHPPDGQQREERGQPCPRVPGIIKFARTRLSALLFPRFLSPPCERSGCGCCSLSTPSSWGKLVR